ncbi:MULTISPECIES: arylesterase [unclassified Aureimonas]|uniref:arylesterase n=2 Tax=unclassified Aureimonas TaxID=2615206 RepID=UPI001FCD6749|nr:MULTISPECIES: arylesterase [unclassified Aureimonas]
MATGSSLAQTAPAAPMEIVAFGDSLSAGYGVEPGKAFPEQLQAALTAAGRNVTVINAGVSGDTTTGGLSRLDWSVPETTDLVILELGANDALRGIAPAITDQNLDAMLERLKARGIRTLFAGMIAPPNMGADYAAGFNPIYERLAEKHGVTLYPFFLEGVAADPGLNQTDKMHPNAAGVARIVERILPVVEAELDAVQAKTPN